MKCFSGIDVGMIFQWHCRSVLSSLNVPNFSFHVNRRKSHFFLDQQLSPYGHFIVDQREHDLCMSSHLLCISSLIALNHVDS